MGAPMILRLHRRWPLIFLAPKEPPRIEAWSTRLVRLTTSLTLTTIPRSLGLQLLGSRYILIRLLRIVEWTSRNCCTAQAVTVFAMVVMGQWPIALFFKRQMSQRRRFWCEEFRCFRMSFIIRILFLLT